MSNPLINSKDTDKEGSKFFENQIEEKLLTVDELKERLLVSKTWIYNKAKSGFIPHIKVGKFYRFIYAEVLEALKSHQGKKSKRKKTGRRKSNKEELWLV